MAITDWPSNERPREKLISQGPLTLSDAELLAIFLRTGISGKTAVDLARELLQKYGSLRALIETNHKQFCQTRGLGTAKYVQLQAVLEMGRRYLRETLKKGDTLASTYDTARYLVARLRGYQHEVFACLFLDVRNRLIECEELFHGTINTSHVYPREVVKRALHHNAAAVIFAHNHPSGVAEPSTADQHITQQLKQALALVEIRVLDHIIIGDGQITSFAEKGIL